MPKKEAVQTQLIMEGWEISVLSAYMEIIIPALPFFKVKVSEQEKNDVNSCLTHRKLS